MTIHEADGLTDYGRPVAPQWNPKPAPGRFGRFLIRLAGVDPNLALGMPLDEQRVMQRVAAAALVGSAFQFLCVMTALQVVAGITVVTVTLALVITAVLLLFDLAFISADWAAQGLTLCRAHGVLPEGGWLDKFKRWGAITARWVLSFLAATIIAQLLLITVFRADIDRYWANDNRSINANIVQSVSERYATLVADLDQRVAGSRKLTADLTRERASLLDPSPSTAQIDRQIEDQLTQQKILEQERSQAELLAVQETTDAAAEQYGVRTRPENTGLSGRGKHFSFHQTQAEQQRGIARAKLQEVEAINRKIENLQVQRAKDVNESNARARSRLDTIERRLGVEQGIAADLSSERKSLEEGREAWIDDHVRQSPGYVPKPDGLLARLDGLLAIITASAALAGFVFFLKAMIMATELAGPITKALLTPPTIYSMMIALRIADAAAIEGDRRSSWRHWRLLATNRRDEAADAINVARHRRDAVSRASREVRDLFENLSAKTH